jgi:GntR family transcriptional regulator, rspAB operon transcriptional repressor
MMSRNDLLKNQAYTEIKALLLEGIYKPGEFLSERQLAERLGMSSTPVRAALERLTFETFVNVYPRQGILVRDLSLQEIKDHYEIRIALETFVVSQIAGRLTDDQIAALESILEEQRQQLDSGSARHYMQFDAAFHLKLCEILGNREIVRMMLHQRDKLYRIVLQLLERGLRNMRSSYEEHVGILEALKLGDGQLAAERMRMHFENGRQILFNA